MNSLKKWQRYFSDNPIQHLQSIYGNDSNLLSQQCAAYTQMLSRFGEIYGDAESVVIARAPGRVNLVGMHIDHQGGAVNPIAIKETRVVAQPRSDGRVVVANCDENFPSRSFQLAEILPKQPVDWESWTREISTQRKNAKTPVDWSDYIKGVLIRLQEQDRFGKLCGMNLLVDTDLPIASGLSSSSALVVAAAYAVMACNDLCYKPESLIELLGESEWYVGLRGGIGDHAVIILGRCGHLSHIQLLPTAVEYAPFPSDYRIVVCHCGVEAKKSADAQNTYNERVAGYTIGTLLLKKRFPQITAGIQRFRDFYPEYLGISTAELYEMLKTLPIRATRAEVAEWLPEHQGTLDAVYQSHHEEREGYRLRGVCLYGMAECERSRKALELLRQGDIERFGQLIDLSHEGDRVFVNGDQPFEPDISDVYFERLIRNSQVGRHVLLEEAELYQQPGAYAASCRELDELVDTARRVDGVLGAGLIGAGLGGSVSVLIKTSVAEELVETLQRDYYAPHEFLPFIEVCTPVAGAGELKIEDCN